MPDPAASVPAASIGAASVPAASVPAPSRGRLAACAVTALLPAAGPWSVTTVAATPSTNTDLVAAAAQGAPHGTVLIADEQTAGKGRLGRVWTAPSGAGLTLSVLLRLPRVPMAQRGWAGVLLGMTVADVCGRVAGVPATLKWPNDVLIDGAKCAGILAEAAGDAVVVGVGLNVSLRRDELPRPDSTSLALQGSSTLDRAVLASAILRGFGTLLDRWIAADGDPDGSGLREEYRERCSSIGARLRVERPDGTAVLGTGVGITSDGAIQVQRADGTVEAFHAADVVHLRLQ